MNEKQQTAVQWLETEMKNRYAIASTHECIDLFKQAIQIEKAQIIDSWVDGRNHINGNILPEHFYHKTYHTEP